MSEDPAGDAARARAWTEQLALRREAGFVPLVQIFAAVATNIDLAAAWLKMRGRLCRGDATGFIFPRGVPVEIPKERWLTPSTNQTHETGKLTLRSAFTTRPPMAVAHDGVMNRPNLNPGAINYGAIDSNGRVKIKTVGGDPADGLDCYMGPFTVFLEENAWPSTLGKRRLDRDRTRSEPKRKTGPKPAVMPRLLEAMRKLDPAFLDTMGFEEMKAMFGASPSYCGEARAQVLGELKSGEQRKTPNIEK